MALEFELHKPSSLKRLLESLSVREIVPSDICRTCDVGRLFENYPDLFGDQEAIGVGDDGYCQSWRGYKEWWKEIVVEKGSSRSRLGSHRLR